MLKRASNEYDVFVTIHIQKSNRIQGVPSEAHQSIGQVYSFQSNGRCENPKLSIPNEQDTAVSYSVLKFFSVCLTEKS